MSWYGGWRPYVPVAQRRFQARRAVQALRKAGVDVQPVEIEGRKIARSFWGEGWCDHLESFSDFENRLPRGRTYVRNGSVCHLVITKGEINALVSGSEIYQVVVQIKPLPTRKWTAVKRRCAGRIGSLLELLQGRLSDQVMEVVTDRKTGLFPLPGEISLGCSCPDWAEMCKHVAAVLYGVGARLDDRPELLFELRGVDAGDLVEADVEHAVATATRRSRSRRLEAKDLADVFDIDLDPAAAREPAPAAKRRRTRAAASKRTAGKPVKKQAPKTKAKAKAKAKAKRAAPKTAAAKKTATRKTAVRTKKKAAARKPAKKRVAKAKRVVPKTTAVGKSVARKTGVRKAVTRKTIAKKTAVRTKKTAVARKAVKTQVPKAKAKGKAKRAAPKTTVVKKTAARKTIARKTTVRAKKKAVTRKAVKKQAPKTKTKSAGRSSRERQRRAT